MLDREGKRGILRDSGNPILEEYKEDLLTRPILIAQSEERIARLEPTFRTSHKIIQEIAYD